MNYLSVCSGIEAVTVAWHPLGWTPVAFAEVDKFPSAVLAHHYPTVPNWGDMTTFQEWPDADIDLIVGGTPCQSFSVAGLRKGLDDPRGNLALTYLAIVDRYRPRWVVWENVPGVLSSNDGRDFGAFVGGLAQLGYLGGYRVLDAQYFGLAQRRKRVFVVAHLGDWRRAAAVLFERASMSGHSAPGREDVQRAAGSAGSCARSGEPIVLDDQGGSMMNVSRDGLVGTLRRETHGNIPIVARPINLQVATRHESLGEGTGFGLGDENDPAFTLSKCHSHAVAMQSDQAMQVRRLTPRECERLQGFPDDYTLIPYRGKPAADGPRYKALGNSMAVPVMHWLGRRIQMVDAIAREVEAARSAPATNAHAVAKAPQPARTVVAHESWDLGLGI